MKSINQFYKGLADAIEADVALRAARKERWRRIRETLADVCGMAAAAVFVIIVIFVS